MQQAPRSRLMHRACPVGAAPDVKESTSWNLGCRLLISGSTLVRRNPTVGSFLTSATDEFLHRRALHSTRLPKPCQHASNPSGTCSARAGHAPQYRQDQTRPEEVCISLARGQP